MITVDIAVTRTGKGRSVDVSVIAVDQSTGQLHEYTVDNNLDPCRGQRYRRAMSQAKIRHKVWLWMSQAGHPFSTWHSIREAQEHVREDVSRYFDILHFCHYKLEYTVRPKSAASLRFIPWLQRDYHVEASYEGTLILRIKLTTS